MSELSKGPGIDNFEVRHLLGKGGFACVYAGYDKRRNIDVAIKMIEQKKIKSSRDMHNRVKQEIGIHCRLKHPSVLELYDVFQDSNYVYLILELCHNGQMQQYLETHSRTLTEDEARAVMHEIIDGLLYLHSHGIVHRDLTLANLLLTKDMHVKISDFGVSTTLEDPSQKHYTMVGTPNYMSPEIITRSAHGQETDLWSLGVMLYICLVGKQPFESAGLQGTFNRVVQGEYYLPDTLSPEARDLIGKMLRKAEGRISMQDILTHPFMRMKPTAAKTTKKVMDISMDSGCGTISSTKCSSSSSCSSVYAPNRRNQPMPAFPHQPFEACQEESRSISSSSSCSRNLPYATTPGDRHPPSPPVRERDSQNEEELRKTNAAMRNINKNMSQLQNIPSAAHRGAEAQPAAYGYHTYHEQHTTEATSQPHFHSLQSNDHQTAQRQDQTFDPRRYKDPDCGSNYNNSAFRPMLHDRAEQYGDSRRDARQLQQTSQNISVGSQNMQTQDLACAVYNFAAKDETQKRLKNSRPVGLLVNKIPVQFSSPEPATGKAQLTEKEMQRCVKGTKKKTARSDSNQAAPELYVLGPPISTKGLTPLRQTSNSTIINILENGDIIMEFTKKKQKEMIVSVVAISSDGMQVRKYTPAVPLPVSDQPLPTPEHCATFVYPNIPQKLVKHYMFASKMVNLIKDKQPKVTVYTNRAKCCLIENLNFTVEFYDGVRALADGAHVKIVDTDGTSISVTSAELNPRLSQETREILDYVQQYRQTCFMIEEAISRVEALIPYTDRLFPIMLGSRPSSAKSARRNTQSVDEKMKPGLRAVSEASTVSCKTLKTTATSARPSSTTPSPASDNSSAHVRLKTAQERRDDSNSKKQMSGDSAFFEASHLNTTGNSSQTTAAFTSMSQSSSPTGCVSSFPHDDVRINHVAGVGWATQKANGDVSLFYQDGSRLCITATKIVSFLDSGLSNEYNERENLPDEILRKLAQFREVLSISPARSQVSMSSAK